MNRDDLNWRQEVAERKALRIEAAHKLRSMATRKPAHGHKRRTLVGWAWRLLARIGRCSTTVWPRLKLAPVLVRFHDATACGDRA